MKSLGLIGNVFFCKYKCIVRLEYDACRTEMELLPPGSQLNEKQREFEKYKEKYEKLKCDVSVKMKFLDENQV